MQVDMEDSAEPAPRIISLLGNLPSRNATNFQSLGASETQQSMLIKPAMPIYRHVLGGRACLKRGDHLTGPSVGDTERPAVPETITEAKSVLVREFEKAAQRLTTAVREEQALMSRHPKRSRKMPARSDSPSC
ncbi:MAG: hypothetical protein WDW38_010422 [Sanguina aurantia]